jgi:uncharacterized protein YegJ (DUF2314 family)
MQKILLEDIVDWKYVKSTKFTVSFVVGAVTALMMSILNNILG